MAGWFYPPDPPPQSPTRAPPGAATPYGNSAPQQGLGGAPIEMWPVEAWSAQRGAIIAGILPQFPPPPLGPGLKGSASSPANFFGVFLDSAEKQFQMFHHLRHVTYDRAASRNGVSLGSLDLTGKVNHDWLLRHSMRHKTYRRITGGGAATVDLESLNWRNKRALRSWLQYHTQLHADLDQFFGLRS